MKDNYLYDADSINSQLFKDSLTPEEAESLYSDPIYGLKNKDNFAKWDALNGEPMASQQFKNELRFYFGLTYLQSMNAETEWNKLFKSLHDFIFGLIPSNYNND